MSQPSVSRISFGILALTLVNSCSPSRMSGEIPPKTGPIEVAIPQHVILPRIVGDDSLILEWLKQLSQPRLNTFSEITAKCRAEDGAVFVEWPTTLFTCTDLNSAQKKTSAFQLLCTGLHSAKLSSSKKKCRTDADAVLWLNSMISPADWGFLVPQENSLWIPNTERFANRVSSLLPFRTVTSNTDKSPFQQPDFKNWLQASNSSGIFALDLELTSSSPLINNGKNTAAELSLISAFEELKSFLQKAKRPKYLPNVLIELWPHTKTLKNIVSADSPAKNILFWTLLSENENPLLKESCQYIDQWMKALQVSAGVDPTGPSTKRMDLFCQFHWADDLIKEYSLRLTRLPLPLQHTESSNFPIKTLDESRSIAILQNLKILK